MILAGAELRVPARGARHRRGAQHPGPARAAARARSRRPTSCTGASATSARTSWGCSRLWAFVREAEGQGHVPSAARVQGQLPVVPARARVGRGPPPARGDRPRAAPAAQGPGRRRRAGTPLHHALLTGLLSRIGQWNPEQRVYIGREADALLRSPLVGAARRSRRPGSWRSSSWRRRSSSRAPWRRSSPEWLAAAAPHLLKRSYSDPHWSEKSARAVGQGARDALRASGLQGAQRRLRQHGPRPGAADVPRARARARRVPHRGGRSRRRTASCSSEVARLRDKARRSDMLATTTRCWRSSTSASRRT